MKPITRMIADFKTNGVLTDIVRERRSQDFKWGEQNHSQMIWLGILAEEFGEAAKEANEVHFRPLNDNSLQIDRLRCELVQVAAVAVAMIESLDRNGR